MNEVCMEDWLYDMGLEAIRRVYAMAESDDLKPELRLKAYQFVAEHALDGKSAADAPEAPPDPLAGLGLEERIEAIRKLIGN